MEFFRQTHIDFMRLRKYAIVFSILMTVVSMAALVSNGLTLGLDFTGGLQLHVAYEKGADLPAVRKQLASSGYEEAVVQSFGSSKDVMIQTAIPDGQDQESVANSVLQALPGAVSKSVEFIGPQVGHELTMNGILALVVSLILTGIYIAMRFEYRFAITSTIALIHDPILILGIFSYFHIEFDLVTLAAVLTVIGYSLNDTVVVFDRVRENFRRMRKATAAEVVNAAVNQTLSRTIMTSGLTLLVVVALFLYGGPVVHGFALAMIIGIAIGTYSSIYIAGSLAVMFGLSRSDLMPAPKAEVDAMP